jgi:hypothetical protein
MGYRKGPPLGPPSAAERKRIRDAKDARTFFHLNTSTLLIRRLIRNPPPQRVDPLDVLMTRVEQRDMAFRGVVQSTSAPIDRYQRSCAKGEAVQPYLFDRRAGVFFGADFTRDVARHRRELAQRYRFRSLLRVKQVPFSDEDLAGATDEVGNDWDDGVLAGLGLRVSDVGTDSQADRIIVDLENPSPEARKVLHDRYGDIVRMNPRPTQPLSSPSGRPLLPP